MLRRIRFTALCATVAALATSAVLAAAPRATGAPLTLSGRHPATPTGLPAAIEPLAPYVAQQACDQRTHPGTLALTRLLERTYHGTSAATVYACGTDGSTSEHYDGRAIDWMVSVGNRAQHADAQAFLSWLLGTDKAGNRFAMARRLGVMYVIYDNRMWGAWDGRWEQYGGCAHLPAPSSANSCHRTHMHISLSWNGAMAHTTYWDKRVSPTDYGPCRLPGLNWAHAYRGRNLVPCIRLPQLLPARKASATKAALVRYSGVAVRTGWSGPAVSAVQQAMHVSPTGTFGPLTRQAVRSFQGRHHLAATGIVNQTTWRALLHAVR